MTQLQQWTDKVRMIEDDNVWTAFKGKQYPHPCPGQYSDVIVHSDGASIYPTRLIFEHLVDNRFDMPPGWVLC